jgi:hypothetical protein
MSNDAQLLTRFRRRTTIPSLTLTMTPVPGLATEETACKCDSDLGSGAAGAIRAMPRYSQA